MSRERPVRWPGKAYAAEADDLGEPLQQLLRDLHVLEEKGDEKNLGPFRGTPYSVQVITAGATALGKGWAAVIGLVGGGGALAAGLTGLGYGSEEPLLAATFTAAQYEARAVISSALLGSANYNRPTAAAPTPHYMAQVGGRWYPVTEFRQGVNGVVADLAGASEVEVARLSGITSTDAWKGN
ncbi:MAG TPA: hypothetical protein VFR87_13590 [Nocardioidaceae bacterium]|nr:hypothetical protein [Nocardioidaceae bacterium]